MTPKTQEILDFWFQGVDDTTVINKKNPPFSQWFIKNSAFDQQIKERFEADLQNVEQCRSWASEVKGALALIILSDQFSRNLYRNTPKMFSTDPFALETTLSTIKAETDEDLPLIERVFLYMPLMHSEDLVIQEMSLQCFEDLIEGCKEKNPRNISYYQYTFDYAKRHHDIIDNFGRFPHRNAILGRTSTPQEVAFLTKPGSSF
jgi:uncharacterized protein (DUF924 family)